MAQASSGEITIREDGVLVGPIRHSVNTAAAAKGSIHDDATATKLGLRGGTVAGSIHMDLFPPLLVQAFGERWFERGNLSLYFLNATVDREPVRAFVMPPAAGANDAQVTVWIEREDGMRVAEGTAAVGDPQDLSALHARPLDRFDPGELRILADVKPGDPIEETGVIYSSDQQAGRMEVITEKMDVYESGERFGGQVVTPAGMVNLLYAQPVATLRKKIGTAVGLFGAIEIKNVNGPALVDTPYRVRGSIASVGQSPKTEYFWFDTELDDLDGKRIAEMRMLLRFMKASSELYREG
jgi:hypothetical protein